MLLLFAVLRSEQGGRRSQERFFRNENKKQANRLNHRKVSVMNKSQVNLGLKFAAVALPLLAFSLQGRADGNDNRAPAVPAAIQVADGNKVQFHAYAIGVQIYTWNGSAWVFVAPEAVLYANADYTGEVGTHYAGPTWESNSGSKVVGVRVNGVTPDPTAIPWLLLMAKTSDGPGIFGDISYIQRVNTVGGIAPATPGTAVGQEARVPYTAEYYFYRDTTP